MLDFTKPLRLKADKAPVALKRVWSAGPYVALSFINGDSIVNVDAATAEDCLENVPEPPPTGIRLSTGQLARVFVGRGKPVFNLADVSEFKNDDLKRLAEWINAWQEYAP